MRPLSGILGVLQPVGGGDPIPLTKPEMVVGRRPGCDIRLDYENISGKHCSFRFLNGLWMIRDLGSTNGTTVNGSLLASEQSLMPDEELGIAGHMFTIEYDPAGPEAFLTAHKELDEEVVQERQRHSLMDLAGLDTDDAKAAKRATRAPNVIERPLAEEAEFDDAVPEHFKPKPKPKKLPTDDDFYQLIEDDVKEPE
jgi:predicted component of type VI protein secretion system